MTFDKAVEKALQNPKYSTFFDDAEKFISGIIDGVLSFIIDILSKIDLPGIPDLSGYNKNALFIAAVAVVCVIFAATVILIVYAVKRRGRNTSYRESVITELFGMLDSKKSSVANFLEESKKFAQAGDYKNAVRYRYVCVLWVLNLRVVPVSPSSVNSRILGDVKNAAPQFYDALKGLADVFDYAWFGGKHIGASDFEEFVVSCDGIMEGAEACEKTQD